MSYGNVSIIQEDYFIKENKTECEIQMCVTVGSEIMK